MKRPDNIKFVIIPEGSKERLPENPDNYKAYFDELDTIMIYSKDQLTLVRQVSAMLNKVTPLDILHPTCNGNRSTTRSCLIESSDTHLNVMKTSVIKSAISGIDYHLIEVAAPPTLKEILRSYRYTMLSNGGYTEDVLLSTLTLYGNDQFAML